MKWTGTGGTSLDSVKWDGRTLGKQQQRKDTRFSSEEKRINMSMALDFWFTRTSWTLSWDVAETPAGWSPSVCSFSRYQQLQQKQWWQQTRMCVEVYNTMLVSSRLFWQWWRSHYHAIITELEKLSILPTAQPQKQWWLLSRPGCVLRFICIYVSGTFNSD